MQYANKVFSLSLGAAILFGASCQQSGPGKNNEKDTTAEAGAMKMAPITIEPVGTSPEFPNAQLSIANATAVMQGTDSAKVSFNFLVKNYALKAQTADTGSKLCNNSAQGQHIHFILDNQPYKALYEPKNDVTVAKNTEHYLMAFLSRSYHESLKNKGAALLYHFKIDENGKLVKMDDPKTPMVFYSRPKGDYLGKDTTNVLLDFYVWNTTLSPDGNKVKAEIRNNDMGRDTTITLTEWKSNFIKNLGTGKSQITLTLVDKDGKQVEGPNTTVTRNFQLAAQEPLK